MTRISQLRRVRAAYRAGILTERQTARRVSYITRGHCAHHYGCALKYVRGF